jgi:DeoR/GlpR family transcriptional regulator of sugar metabolism
MLTEQRHEIILNLLSEKGSITVTELKDILNTSESTIRRDLNTLDEQGHQLQLLQQHRLYYRYLQLLLKLYRQPEMA